METERIELSARDRERLKVLQQVEEGHIQQVEAARRLRVSDRQVRRWQQRLRKEGDRGILHRLRGRRSNRKIPEARQKRAITELRQPRYAGFGPTLASEHLARAGLVASRETLRQWMVAAGLWQVRRRQAKRVHVWRPRRCCRGELVMMDSSPFAWLEERGPRCHLIAMIDDATSQVWGRLVEHDSTEENLRTLGGWVQRHGRPLALYTDKNSLFVTSRPVQWHEQLQDQPARTQFGRALAELDIEWITAHSPQAKGRVERLFGTLQDRLVKEMRLAEIATLEAANRFLEITFWPFWNQRFVVAPARSGDAHRRLDRSQRLEEILSVRAVRTVGSDHTVSWDGQRWGLRREQVCAGLRGAHAEIEKRLDGTHWLRFRGRYLPLQPCPTAPRSASPGRDSHWSYLHILQWSALVVLPQHPTNLAIEIQSIALEKEMDRYSSLAAGLQKDFAVVPAAVETHWSNGQVEGQIQSPEDVEAANVWTSRVRSSARSRSALCTATNGGSQDRVSGNRTLKSVASKEGRHSPKAFPLIFAPNSRKNQFSSGVDGDILSDFPIDLRVWRFAGSAREEAPHRLRPCPLEQPSPARIQSARSVSDVLAQPSR